jgi:Ca2+-binding EF-hand superfamily protein
MVAALQTMLKWIVLDSCCTAGRMNAQSFSIAGLLVVALAAWAAAQDRDDGRRRDRDDQRSSRDNRGSDSSAKKTNQPLVPGFGESAGLPAVPGFGLPQVDGRVRSQGIPLEDRYTAAVIRYVDGILQRYDRNRSRMLERTEWAAVSWRSDPVKSDTNGDGTLSREELCERVKDFDEVRGGEGSSASGGSADERQKVNDYAKSLMDRYDANDNGVIDEDEARKMGGYHQGADANGDKTITREELIDRLADFGKNGAPAAESRPGPTPAKGNAKPPEPPRSSESYRVTAEGDEGRKPYHPRTDLQRLPKGLPDWFTRNDADGDGQIAMAEFSVSWTDAKLQEFRKYDVNTDGVITPDEFLSAAKSSSGKPAGDRQR